METGGTLGSEWGFYGVSEDGGAHHFQCIRACGAVATVREGSA